MTTNDKQTTNYHIPVLLEASIQALNIHPEGIYVDTTFGGGGHSRAILEAMGDTGHLYSFDQDLDAIKNCIDNPRFTFVRSNFKYLRNFLKYHGVEQVDGILADLGVSSHHLDEAERGFSFRFDAPLDMRMNKRAQKTAAEIVNTYEERQLATLFYLYGEIKESRRLAAKIVRERAVARIETTHQLVELTRSLFGREREKKEMAKMFQALRIEVNEEMDALKEMLQATIKVLKPGGRLVVITYHSLEDRIVKNIMKSGNIEGIISQDFYGNRTSPFKIISKKIILPSEEEMNQNPRSRSAKLRVVEKI
ncbi:MAG: 16S rRNA (cytosine(1402)-N(4))-methyltransferase RsmH [Bacteroidaceae bacterium]|nr:16S rRNA (cytosine(1402)-N(4))-methyltransferase RsmH [Bacteroidaceae bacterium]